MKSLKYLAIVPIILNLYCPISAQDKAATGQSVGKSLSEYVRTIAGHELSSAQISVFATDAAGKRLIDMNGDKLMMPASNMKLISTGLALHTLGSDFKYETRLGYSGKIDDGVLKGNLYIIGSGDPSLASDDSIAVRSDILFNRWKHIVRSAGITSIDGHIIGDSRVFPTMAEVPSWQYDDTGTYYGTGTCGLTFYENIQTFHAAASAIVGEKVHISEGYPHCPWMNYTFDCTTGKAGTGDKLYYYASDLAPVGEIRGTFAIDRSSKKLEFSNKFPAYTCAWHFCEFLDKQGIKCSKGAADTKVFAPAGQTWVQDSITVIGSTFSPTLKRIAFETNHESNNLYAETLYLTMGKELTGTAHRDSSAVVTARVLKSMGIDPSGARLADGSGLSRQNYISTSMMCSFLSAMADSPAYNDFIYSLPSPGSKGTMETVMTGYGTTVKSRIRLKSGSMTGVKCFSGYILPESPTRDADTSDTRTSASKNIEKPVVFSIMINNSTLSQYSMQKIIDRILYLLTL